MKAGNFKLLTAVKGFGYRPNTSRLAHPELLPNKAFLVYYCS